MNELDMAQQMIQNIVGSITIKVERLNEALFNLRDMTLFLIQETSDDQELIENWLHENRFETCEDGFFQSKMLLELYRKGNGPATGISYSWNPELENNQLARFRMYAHRNMGKYLLRIHKRLDGIAWIYYQDVTNTALQFPFIDQVTAIKPDFDWTTYHTFKSVSPENNPGGSIRWLPPTVDYAGKGWIISVSIPVYKDSVIAGVWTIDVSQDYILDKFLMDPVVNGNKVFLVNSKGDLILRPKMPHLSDQQKGKTYQEKMSDIEPAFSKIAFSELFTTGQGKLFLSEGHSNKSIAFYRTIDELNWICISIIPRNNLFEASKKQFLQAFGKLGKGDLEYRLDDNDWTLPMHELVSEFNYMANQINSSFLEIEEQNKKLKTLIEGKKLGEKLLRDKNLFIESIVSLSPDILYIYDIIHQMTVYSNESIQNILGYSTGEIKEMGTKTISNLMHPDDLQRYNEQICPEYQTVNDNEPVHNQFRMKHKQGHWCWLDCREIIFSRQTDGTPKEIFGVIRDITGQKQAETALLEANHTLNAIFEAAPLPIFTLDREGLVQFAWNPAAEKLLGWKKENIIGQYLPTVSDDMQDEFEKIRKTVLSGKMILGKHVKRQRIDGVSIDYSIYSAPLRNADDEIYGNVCMLLDLTERIKAENELRERIKEAGCLYNIADISQNSKFSLEEFLTKAAGLIPQGFLYPEFTGCRITYNGNFFKTQNFKETTRMIKTSIQTRQKSSEQIEVCCLKELSNNDIPFFLNEKNSLLNEIGRQLGEYISRKHVEEEITRLNRQLTNKNKELEQIVYVTSHDLRSPLVNIQGFSQELERCVDIIVNNSVNNSIICDKETQKKSQDTTFSIKKSLGYIKGSAAKMDEMLAGLLRMSRLSHAEISINDIDPNIFLSGLLDQFKFQIKEKGVKFNIENLPLCRGDEKQISQAFLNLIDNALKYLEPSRKGIISITGYKSESVSIYCIEDNGIGIAREHKNKIFEIFHRLNPENDNGEGLGLNIVSKILGNNHGDIKVESEPGKGTRFYISLPGIK